jgi:hypothetical protein
MRVRSCTSSVRQRATNKKTIKQRELFAVDFCPPGWTAKRWSGFNAERDKISANLERLSIDRPPVGEMWEYTRLRDDLKDMRIAFLDAADDRLSQHLKGAIRGILNGADVPVADTAPTQGAD